MQIIQCEKAIHLCRLKDRTEQVNSLHHLKSFHLWFFFQSIKDQQAEHQSKLARTYSTSYLTSSAKSNRLLTRHHTFQIDHSVMLDDLIYSKTNETSSRQMRTIAKKNQKNDSHKIEELQMSYEALKTHLKAAFDDIERLKHENNQLRVQTSIHTIEEQNEPRLLTNSEEDGSETELEATL